MNCWKRRTTSVASLRCTFGAYGGVADQRQECCIAHQRRGIHHLRHGPANAYKILEDTLNLRDVRIYDTIQDADGREQRVLNQKATTLAQQKQQAIKDAFREWIWKDPDRRQALVAQYNELFNSVRPREYDGRHIVFSGMNPEISLREHQRNAVAHILYGGNTLLAHQVGAGKTFEMVAAAMESKRLGLCQKSMFVVPNHLTGAMGLRVPSAVSIRAHSGHDQERL